MPATLLICTLITVFSFLFRIYGLIVETRNESAKNKFLFFFSQ